MDNRKVYRSYKDKLKTQIDSTKPYSFTSRLKGLWNNSRSDGNSNKPAKPEPSSQVKLPGSFEDPDQTANEVLSNFFKQKGDNPLSEVEYEGVMSLINKSKTVSLNKSSDDSMIKAKKQKLLKHDPNTTITTPGYKPTYKSVNDSTFENYNNTTISHIPALKRVYQFSGIPSPYRTKIRPPVLKRKPDLTNHSVIETSVKDDTFSKDNQPKSQTARALLDVLDRDEEPKTKPDSEKIKLFINPYGSRKRRKSIAANDIEKTKSFDRSETLEPKVESFKPTSDHPKTELETKSRVEPMPIEPSNSILNASKLKTGVSNPDSNSTKISSLPSKANGFDFEFPKPEIINVQLDTVKINSFKSLFQF